MALHLVVTGGERWIITVDSYHGHEIMSVQLDKILLLQEVCDDCTRKKS